MNKTWLYKSLALFLATSSCFGLLNACSKEEEKEIAVSLPEYANDKEIDLLGYVVVKKTFAVT